MKPQDFHESNGTLGAPKGMEDNCGELHVYSNGQVCISCWQPTEEDKARIAAGGPIWLTVVSGHTQPPVSLRTDHPFIPDGPAG